MTRRSRSWLEWLTWTRVGACLSGGFVLSVAASWVGAGFAAWPSAFSESEWSSRPRGLTEVPSGVEHVAPLVGGTCDFEDVVAFSREPLIRRTAYRVDRELRDNWRIQSVDVYATGWPRPALEWSNALGTDLSPAKADLRDGSGLDRAWDFGINYYRRGTPEWDQVWRRLPLRPADFGLGLVVDSLFWGLVCVPIVGAPGWIRHRRRRARGLCAMCGYPVRGADGVSLRLCPECGVETSSGRIGTPVAVGEESHER